MKEIWKDIKGYEGYYQVSNTGRIRSLDRVVYHSRSGCNTIKGQIFGLSLRGYTTIGLSRNSYCTQACCKSIYKES